VDGWWIGRNFKVSANFFLIINNHNRAVFSWKGPAMSGLLRNNKDYGEQPTGEDTMESREILAGLMVKTAKLLVTMEEKRVAASQVNFNKQPQGVSKILFNYLAKRIDNIQDPNAQLQAIITIIGELVDKMETKSNNEKDPKIVSVLRRIVQIVELSNKNDAQRTVNDQIDNKRPGISDE